jgi:CubicO group peptidase (beta-lactamase class C family)
MKADHLKAAIIEVTEDGRIVTAQAFGDSMDGVPATTAMHFRNGAVAFQYVATLLMEFVDEHKVTLNDTIARWMPALPEADKVTLKMLANQTTGYPDFETDPAWLAAFNADPFHIWTFGERLKYAFARPLQFAPGTNWSYSHTNFMILGEILAKIGHQPLGTLLRQKVLDPMGLANTTSTETSEVPNPILHSFSSERRVAVGIPPGHSFYEEATFWNTQWGTPIGANETTDINDMATTAAEVQLPRDDRPEPAGLRTHPAQLRAQLFQADEPLQLRAWRRAVRIVAAAGPAAQRRGVNRGLPPRAEDRHRRCRDVPAGSL